MLQLKIIDENSNLNIILEILLGIFCREGAVLEKKLRNSEEITNTREEKIKRQQDSKLKIECTT